MNSVKKILIGVYLKLLGKDQKSRNLKRLKDQIKEGSLKLVLGSSGIFQEGWVGTDIDTLDMLKKSNWNRLFKPGTVEFMLAEHVWEHLTPYQANTALSNCFHFLKKGGHFRIAVPDGFHPDPSYINYVKPGGHGAGADDHKILYNYISLKKIFEEVGFTVKLLEYFDEEGRFHYSEWKVEDGLVNRSKRFDKRNVNGALNYTSLILDGIK